MFARRSRSLVCNARLFLDEGPGRERLSVREMETAGRTAILATSVLVLPLFVRLGLGLGRCLPYLLRARDPDRRPDPEPPLLRRLRRLLPPLRALLFENRAVFPAPRTFCRPCLSRSLMYSFVSALFASALERNFLTSSTPTTPVSAVTLAPLPSICAWIRRAGSPEDPT